LHEVFWPALLLCECNHSASNLDGLRKSYWHLRGGVSESVTMT